MNIFLVNETYKGRFIGDSSAFFSYIVVGRTPKRVKLKEVNRKGEVNATVVTRAIKLNGDTEYCMPLGTYSKAPVLSAARVVGKAEYNQDLVIEYLTSLSFPSLTMFIYTRNNLVADRFGCSQTVAAQWINRTMRTGLIKETDYGFVLTIKAIETERMENMRVIQAAVDSGKVVRLASFRCNLLRKNL